MKTSCNLFFFYLTVLLLFVSPLHAEESLPWLTDDTLAQTHSPTPSSSPVTEKKISPISYATVGLITEQEGSLGNLMWQGTSGALAHQLLRALPAPTHSHTLYQLRYRLLTTPATPPYFSKPQDYDLFVELRIKQLAAMEKYDAIRRLIAKLPSHRITESMHQTLILSLLKTQIYDKACNHVHITLKYFNTPAWQQLATLCHILQQKWQHAELSIALLKTLPVKLQTIYLFEQWVEDQTIPTENALSSLITAIFPSDPFIAPAADNVTLPSTIPLTFKSLSDLWWKQLRTLPSDERLYHISQFYHYLEANNYPVSIQHWESLFLSSPSPLPSVTLRLLRDAAYKRQRGKTIALILFAINDTAITDLDSYTISTVISALHQINLHYEASALTQEFLRSTLPK